MGMKVLCILWNIIPDKRRNSKPQDTCDVVKGQGVNDKFDGYKINEMYGDSVYLHHYFATHTWKNVNHLWGCLAFQNRDFSPTWIALGTPIMKCDISLEVQYF